MHAPTERAIHRRTTHLQPHANEFGDRETAATHVAQRGVFTAAQNPRAGCKASVQADFRGMPCPGIFDWPAPSIMSAHCQKRGDIGQQACSTGLASRTADGNPTGVARPSRHWATGDCTRCKKPDRPGLRQSSGAPRLPVFTATKRRVIVASCLPSCDARFVESRRCNEVRLLSRRIIIRLFDDVKKKVQKNLRARSNRSNSRARSDDDTIDTHSDDDSRKPIEVPSRACFDGPLTHRATSARCTLTPRALTVEERFPHVASLRSDNIRHTRRLPGKPHDH
jgi:hypothetical protein